MGAIFSRGSSDRNRVNMASQDHGTQVQHVEGASYAVAFGDPERHPLPSAEDYICPDFPAGDGQNPYAPESHLLAPVLEELENSTEEPGRELVCRAGCALSAYVYETIKYGSERSFERTRGLDATHMLHITSNVFPDVARVVDALRQHEYAVCVATLVYLYRMCHLDGTFAAFSETPPEQRGGEDSVLGGFYFTLSAQERKRHRVLRRMPYVVARQLALKKHKKDPAAPRRLLILEDAPEELFRVVVSFL
jgi:hypothetical protein